jgi:hypothetical protein
MRLLSLALLLASSAPLGAQSVAVATTSGGGHSRSSVSVTASFGQPVRINHMVFRPVAVVQDSRCPANANCVWAGQLIVELQTAPGKRIRLEMGKPLAIGGGRLMLLGASPAPIAGNPIPPASYRFQLRFEKP